MASPVLKNLLQQNDCLIVPGVQDMIAVQIADKIGFPVLFGTGYWLTASAYGLPDAGLVSYTQMLDRMQTLVRTSKAAIIADADTGFGGLLNVDQTVRGYEAAGVTAIQIEDQEFPKKCGHTPGKRIVPAEDMCERIMVACDARSDRENFQIIARTDAYQKEGLDGVMFRLDAYARAGADILFPEALSSEDEIQKVTKAFDLPVMVNMANGSSGPIFSKSELTDLGISLAIFPSLTSLIALKAMEAALTELKETGNGNPPADQLFSFSEFSSMIGFDQVLAFDKKWARER